MITDDDWRAIGLVDVEQIGRGGFGVVYRAVEEELGRTVAVKVLPGELDERARDRFDRERRAMAVLSDHPHIVPIFRSGFVSDGSPFLVMEYVSGGSMAERIDAGPLPWAQVARLGVELSGALETAHRAGVLHRDVKPGNILLSALGAAKLADFGIARLHGAPETRSASVTASVAHAPPEVVAGRRPDHRADVYSLASTLFELLTGRPPFVRPTDESLVPVLARIAQDPVPDLRDRGVPDAVCAALERGMAKELVERTPSAVELGRDLQVAERSLGVPVSELLVVGEAAALPADSDATTDLGSVAAVPPLPPSEPVRGDDAASAALPTPTAAPPTPPDPHVGTGASAAAAGTAGSGQPPPEVVTGPTPTTPAAPVPWWRRPIVLASAAAVAVIAVIAVAVLGGGDDDQGGGTAGPVATTPDTTVETAPPDPEPTGPPPEPEPTDPPATDPPPTDPPGTRPDRTPPDIGDVLAGGVTPAPGEPASETLRVTDDTGAITMLVPADWSDVQGGVLDGAATLLASPDVAGAIDAFDTPGVLVQIDQLGAGVTVPALLDFLAEPECVSGGRQPFAFEDFTGEYEVWGGCGGTITVISHAALISSDGAFGLIISTQAVEPVDISDLSVVLASISLDRNLVP